MFNWIFSTQPTSIVFVGIASAFLLYGPSTEVPQEIYPATESPAYVHPITPPVVVDPALARSIRFQQLVSQWRTERGATSSIEEMCTRPAYLSIMAMGPDALPLLVNQLRMEGDEPDHWFVALHYITGADPVPDQDKGYMVKMSEAWLAWAEAQEDYAG